MCFFAALVSLCMEGLGVEGLVSCFLSVQTQLIKPSKRDLVVLVGVGSARIMIVMLVMADGTARLEYG